MFNVDELAVAPRCEPRVFHLAILKYTLEACHRVESAQYIVRRRKTLTKAASGALQTCAGHKCFFLPWSPF